MRTLALILAVASLTSACSGYSTVAEQRFGNAVRGATAAQTVNPQASLVKPTVATMDGQAAKSAVDTYQRSFNTPTKQTSDVLNIGVGGSDGK